MGPGLAVGRAPPVGPAVRGGCAARDLVRVSEAVEALTGGGAARYAGYAGNRAAHYAGYAGRAARCAAGRAARCAAAHAR